MPSMGENSVENPEAQGRSPYAEYGDALSDVLQDQARRSELRAEDRGPTRPHIHAAATPLLALVSIWLWVFPPSGLVPPVPTVSPTDQEAGLRMEMFVQFNNIQRYRSEHGSLPGDLQEVGDGPAEVGYLRLSSDTFRLRGETGDIMVEYVSTEPVEALLANAMAVVSGSAPSAPGAPVI